MAVGYKPVKCVGFETGLVQEREQFLLPFDGFPVLENAFVWRERIKRKQGTELLYRLRRVLTAQALGNTDGSGNFSGNIVSILGLEATAEIELGSIEITVGAQTFVEATPPDGTLTNGGAGTGTINYVTGALTLNTDPNLAATAITIDFGYFPRLPVMGLLTRELDAVNSEQVVAFDTTYAYILGATGWQEFIPGTTWSGSNSDLFWGTNYWVDASNNKLFWVTNFSGPTGDPIRYTDGTTWFDFGAGSVPLVGQIDAAGNFLNQCLVLIPFRGRMLALNTWEGMTLAGSTQQRQRIRWAAIGNPLTTNAWRDDIRGQGGFLDLPTSQNIIAAGFVRDNLVIFCERSTWQLRYTGQSIQPFQIEKVNTELGIESTFSAIPFDTSLVGVGDKGIISCDSFQASRIDIKIPDFVYSINNNSDGTRRVYGIRDFVQRLAYWSYPTGDPASVFPNRRLVYNYENDSFAIHTDSFTCFGTYQPPTSRRWNQAHVTWASQNIPWKSELSLNPVIIAGNQQGYVSKIDRQTTNDVSLTITAIVGNDPNATRVTSANHNLVTGQFIKIYDIPTGNDFDNLNGVVFQVDRISSSVIDLYIYDSATGTFFLPQVDSATKTYIGGGQMAVLDNFRIRSKKFDHMQEGQKIQIGYVDILTSNTSEGAITFKMYVDYRDDDSVNSGADTFFNRTVSTASSNYNPDFTFKTWHRVVCPTRANFLQFEWTLSDEQMNGIAQESEVQIDAQVIWERTAGRLTL